MTIRYIFLLVAGLVFLCLFPKVSFGSHAMGSDITYTCVGPNQYQITVAFYRDCDGVAAPATISVDYSSQSCGRNGSATLNQLPNTGLEVSQICGPLLDSSTCNGGSLYAGVQQYLYSGTITLPAQCSDWIVGYSTCCRNALIENLQNPDNFSIYTFATINNVIGCNNSPFFTSFPVPYVCALKLKNYNQGAVDIDGDSLYYRLVQPWDDYQVPIAYQPGYRPDYPLSTTTGRFNFDPNTGQMSFTPDRKQVSVLTVIVEEYRNGVLIGTTMRDIQIIVESPSFCPSDPTAPISSNLTGGGFVDSSTIQVCPNTLLSFDLTTTDQSGSGGIVSISSNASSALPGATFTATPPGPTAVGTFSWIPTASDTGFHPFQVTYGDDGCPIPSAQTITITINVFNKVTINQPDLVFCDLPQQLEAVGGSFFIWTPTDDLSDPTIANPIATPQVPTMYYARSDCGVDSVFIDVQPGYTLDVGKDTTICRNQNVQLDGTVSGGLTPYTYNWTPPNGLDDPTIPDPVAKPSGTTTYFLESVSSVGCIRNDTVQITVSGVAPNVEEFATPDTVCPGETVRLDVRTTPGSCGINTNPCASPAIDNFELGTGSTWTGLGTPYQGQFSDGRALYLYQWHELRDIGIQGGTIKELSFRVEARGSLDAYENMTIKMGCTSAFTITDFVSGLDVVYNPKSHFATGGWNTHVLDNPYDWDGTSNLLIEVCYDNPSPLGGHDEAYFTTTTGNSVVFATSDMTSGCNLSIPAVGTNRPNIRLGLCTPSLAGSGISWEPIGNIIGSPNIQNPTAQVFKTTTFRASVNQGGCVGKGPGIDVHADTAFIVDAGPDTSLCVPSTVQLSSNVTGTFSPVQLNCGINNTSPSPPVTYTFGNIQGTNFSPGPYYGDFNNGRLQFLLRRTEMTAAGISQGVITDLAFNVTSQGSNPPGFNNFTIKMACTSLQALTNDFEPGLNTVFTPKNITTSVGWNNYTFDNPYDWDGFANIIVEVCFENSTDVRFDNVSNSPTTFNNSTLHGFDNWIPGCTIGAGNLVDGQVNLFNSRPDIQLGVSPPPLADLDYSWSPNINLSDSTSENPAASPTVTTTYRLQVSDGNCVATDQVTITYYTDYDANVFGSNIGCNGSSDGNAVSAPTGGVPPYDFAWNTLQTANGVVADTLFDLFAGTYAVTVTDNNGCSANDSILITVPAALGIDMDSSRVSCYGGRDGSTTADGIDGTPPYTYIWSNGEDSSTALNLNVGIYSVTVTDASGCIAVDSVSASGPTQISLTMDSTAASCFGESDGIASVSAIGGTPPFTYMWNDSQSTPAALRLSAGVYFVVVTDNNDCIVGGFTEVLQPDSFSITVNAVDATCYGGSDGEATANVATDTTNYSFSWGTGQLTANVKGLTAGTIPLTVTDSFNCSRTRDVTIDQPDEIHVSFITTDVSCYGGTDGTAVVTVGSGGTPSYSFQWSNSQTGDSATNLTAGQFGVIVLDSLLCPKNDTITIAEPTPISISDSAFDVSCYGGSDGRIETIITGGTPPYTYIWSNGQTTPIAVTLSIDTSYSVIVADANNCRDTSQNNSIDQPTQLTLGTVDVFSPCPGGATGRIVASASGAVPPYDFTLNPLSSLNTDGNFTGLEAGNYQLLITDQNGCGPIDTSLTISPFDSISVSFNPDLLEVRLNEDTLLQPDIIPVGSHSYFWNPPTGLDCDTCPNPLAGPAINTTYELIVTDSNGCPYSATIAVEVTNELILWVPNAFTPNGDGLNDFLYVYGLSVKRVIFMIYNRWGAKVFQTTDPNEGWNGTFGGKLVPPDVYVYYVAATFEDGQEKTLKGSVAVLK